MGKKNQRKPKLQLDKTLWKNKSDEPTKDDQTPSTSQSENKRERKKSTEKDSPSPESNKGGESPDPNCAICLGKLENKSFTDSCFHTFCFVCLLEWSKVQAVCPLCKQPFKSIIHNVRSNEDYEQYHLKQTEKGHFENDRGARFRYRTTLVDRATRSWLRMRRETTDSDVGLQRPSRYTTRHQWRRRRQAATSAFRRRVYSDNLRVRRLNTDSRYRDTSPAFFSGNPAQTHRLVPWLNRELNVLLSHHEDHVNFVLELILDLIKRFDIHSEEFRQHILPFTGRRTEHFIHEFYHFARAPFDMVAYDQVAVYDEAQAQVHTIESSSSENGDNPNDPDIVILTPPEGFNPPPPSGAVDHNYSWGNLALPFGFREPAAPRNMGPFGLDLTPLLDRVRSFLNTSDSAAPSQSSWDSPTPGPSSAVWSPPQPTSPDEIEILSGPSPNRPSTSDRNNSDSQNQRSESSRTVDSTSDTSSSAGSDIEIVGYEKPFEDRTPIKVSSDEEIIIDGSPYLGKKDKKKKHKDKTKKSRWDERPSSREKSRSERRKHRSRSKSRERPSHSHRSEPSREREVSHSNDQYKKDRDRHRDNREKRKDRHRSDVKSKRDFRTRSRSRSPVVRSEVLVISHSQKSTHSKDNERKERGSRDLIASHVQAIKDYTESRRRSNSKSKEDRHERNKNGHKRKHSRSSSIEFIRESHREKSRHRSKKHKKSKKHHKEKKSSKRHRHSSGEIEVLEVRKTSHRYRSSSETSSHNSSYKKHHSGHKKSSKSSAISSTSGANTEFDRHERVIDLASPGSQSSCSSSASGEKSAKKLIEKKGEKLKSIVKNLQKNSKKSKRSRDDSITEVLSPRSELGESSYKYERGLEENHLQNNIENKNDNTDISEDIIETEINSLLKRQETSSSNSDGFADVNKILDIFASESPLDIPLPVFPEPQICDKVEQVENVVPGNSNLEKIPDNELLQNDKSAEEITPIDNTELGKTSEEELNQSDKSAEEITTIDNTELWKSAAEELNRNENPTEEISVLEGLDPVDKSTEEMNQLVETAEETISDTLVPSNEEKVGNYEIDKILEKKPTITEKIEEQNVASSSKNPDTGAIVESSTSFMTSDASSELVNEEISSGMQQCDKNINLETDSSVKLKETLQNDPEKFLSSEKPQTSGASLGLESVHDLKVTPDIPLDVAPKASLAVNEHSEECDTINAAKDESPSIDNETKTNQLQGEEVNEIVTENILGIDMTPNDLKDLETSLRQKILSRVIVNETGEETES